jgi:hypothetical protein
MQTPYPQLTSEQRQAITASGGLPIRIEDPDTHKIYVLMEQPGHDLPDDDYVRTELSKGIAALEAGERVAWDPERIKQIGRQSIATGKAPD